MPIYVYRCSACGFEDEVLQNFSDLPLTVCSKCNQKSLSKQLTAAGFQLKGSGWYVTDFRDKGTSKAAKPDSESSADPTPKNEEAKPKTQSEPAANDTKDAVSRSTPAAQSTTNQSSVKKPASSSSHAPSSASNHKDS